MGDEEERSVHVTGINITFHLLFMHDAGLGKHAKGMTRREGRRRRKDVEEGSEGRR